MAMFFGYNQYWPDGFMAFMSRRTSLVSTINRATIGPLAKRHRNGASPVQRADSGLRLVDGWEMAQQAVVLILKHLKKGATALSLIRQTERSQESNPWPPGLQGICYRRRNSLVCGRVPWL